MHYFSYFRALYICECVFLCPKMLCTIYSHSIIKWQSVNFLNVFGSFFFQNFIWDFRSPIIYFIEDRRFTINIDFGFIRYLNGTIPWRNFYQYFNRVLTSRKCCISKLNSKFVSWQKYLSWMQQVNYWDQK